MTSQPKGQWWCYVLLGFNTAVCSVAIAIAPIFSPINSHLWRRVYPSPDVTPRQLAHIWWSRPVDTINQGTICEVSGLYRGDKEHTPKYQQPICK